MLVFSHQNSNCPWRLIEKSDSAKTKIELPQLLLHWLTTLKFNLKNRNDSKKPLMTLLMVSSFSFLISFDLHLYSFLVFFLHSTRPFAVCYRIRRSSQLLKRVAAPLAAAAQHQNTNHGRLQQLTPTPGRSGPGAPRKGTCEKASACLALKLWWSSDVVFCVHSR